MMFAATAASVAETSGQYYSFLALSSIVLGLLGYAFLTLGCFRLSGHETFVPWWTATVPAAIVLGAGYLTDFHLENDIRASTFNAFAALSLALCAWRFHTDGKAEPLPVRAVLTVLFLGSALLCLVVSIEFYIGSFPVIEPTPAFFCMIIFKYLLSLFTVVLATERVKNKLDDLANTDALTGARNRRSFFDTVQPVFRAGDAIALIDIDHFKRLNDAWGHSVGDDVLKSVVLRIQETLRAGDIFARYGGEEFIVFLRAVSQRQAIEIAECIRKAVESMRLEALASKVTISVGVAHADETTELKQVINLADKALYLAKESGRNQALIYPYAQTRPLSEALSA
ncbi:GGDEF domain-containing protein [Pararhizobium antarcticum]|nr:GGDEF domain-containing protein [Pararhizobium antarcticum]